MTQTYSINTTRGISVARLVCDSYLAGRGVFADKSDLLENQIPTGVEPLSRLHANFLFFLICQDHGVKSFRLYERAKRLYALQPWLFEPRAILASFRDGDDLALTDAVSRRLGTRYPNETTRQWYRNALDLESFYDADARNLFRNSKDSPDALRRIRSFRGFGPKTSALLFRTFYGCGFFRLSGADSIPIPVDIHDTRIAVTCGLLRIQPRPNAITSDNYMRYAKAAQRAWIEVCRVASLDWLILDRALWLLGSRGCSAERYLQCCISRDCLKR